MYTQIKKIDIGDNDLFMLKSRNLINVSKMYQVKHFSPYASGTDLSKSSFTDKPSLQVKKMRF